MNFGNKKKLVLVIDNLGYGGRERNVFDLANRLDRNLYSIFIIVLSNDCNELKSILRPDVQVIEMDFKRAALGGFSALLFWVKGLHVYVSLLKKIQPGIVHTNLLFQQLLFGSTGIWLSQTKAKHFHSVQTAGLYFASKSLMNRIRLATEKFAVRLNKAYLISVSETVQAVSVKNFHKQASGIRCINNGVDAEKFNYKLRDSVSRKEYGFNETDIIVVYVARMDEGKDHITLLKAWQTVAKKNINAKLCLIGNGELKTMLQTFALENQLDRSITFLNSTPDIHFILAIADIGVFPSLFEGLPISLLEKMFMKLPVVGSNIPSVASIIRDGYNGLLFEPKDFATLALKLDRMINDADFRHFAAENAWLSVQQYNLDTTIKMHSEYYEVSTNH